VANEWRQHPLLKGRFLPDYPDDLAVIVHDGGPKITSNEPEIAWVTVTAMDGDVFRGRVQSLPRGLDTVHQNDEVQFVMPENPAPAELAALGAQRLGLEPESLAGWLAPLLVTQKYLRERPAWVIHPCDRCGLSELFDAPSDLIRVLFPHHAADVAVSRFTAPCPNCGGEQRVHLRGVTDTEVASSSAGNAYLQAVQSQIENIQEIATLLASIVDDSSADLALAEVDKRIARQNDLDKDADAYELSMEDHEKLAREHYHEYLKAHSDLSVNQVTVLSNAACASSRAPGKAKAIEAVLKKIGLS
jgi:hypothetical protein